MKSFPTRWFATAILLCWVAGVAAQAPKKVTIVSLIGDGLTVVTYRPSTSDDIRGNYSTPVAIGNTLLDRVAMLTLTEGLSKGFPAERLATLAVPEPGSDFDPNLLFDESALVKSSPMQAPVLQAGFTHLLVVTKLRAAAKLRYVDGTFGTGALTGLGFYVDQDLEWFNETTRQTERGFVAPYAYFRVSLVEMASLKLIAEERITINSARSSGSEETGRDALNILTPAEKISSIRALIEAGIKAAVPRLLPLMP